MVRFIHSADWQIGMTRHFLSDESQSRYAEARLESVRRIARMAADQHCDFAVVAGDVFESNLLDRRVVARALDALTEFTVPVVLLPGNHDPLIGAGSVWDSPAFAAGCPPQVSVLRDTTPVRVPGSEVEVVGAVWHSKRPIGDLVAAALADLTPGNAPRVLVGHGAVDHGSPDPGDPALIRLATLEAALADGRIAYAALGDRHSTTQVGATGRVWYAGTPLVTDYTEEMPNHVLLVELEGDRVTVTPTAVGDWHFRTAAFAVHSDADLAQPQQWLAGLPDKRRCVAKLSFVGTVSLATKIRLDALVDEYRDVLAALEVWDRRTDLAVLPDNADFADMGFGGFVATAIEELGACAASGGPDADAAQDALSLLFRLTRDRT